MSTTAVGKRRYWAAAVVPLVVVGGMALLYWVPPTVGSYYPPCLFYSLTGLHCPGCGATRSLYALLHGDLAGAARQNIVFLIASPFLCYWALRVCHALITGRSAPAGRLPTWLTWTLIGLMIGFWVMRNIPCELFTMLAPQLLQGSEH